MPPWLDQRRARSAELDRLGARVLHRAVAHPNLVLLLALASRLGDGALWFALLLLWPLVDGEEGWLGTRLAFALGAINLLLYWVLKRCTRRQRPFEQCDDIRARITVPDAFSFPSGHTLHASAYALLLTAFYPSLAPLLWSFAVLVGVSRVVLGVHYPSDVLAGALIGAGTASLVVLLGR